LKEEEEKHGILIGRFDENKNEKVKIVDWEATIKEK